MSVASDAVLGTGNLSFDGGTLRPTANLLSSRDIALPGAGTIDTNGFATTLSGPITGSGSLAKAGAGTLILAGTNTYTGGTTVGAGVLQGSSSSLQGAIVNNASVVFDQPVDGTYAGAMSGSGALIKGGAGTLSLTGNNTYTGGRW